MVRFLLPLVMCAYWATAAVGEPLAQPQLTRSSLKQSSTCVACHPGAPSSTHAQDRLTLSKSDCVHCATVGLGAGPETGKGQTKRSGFQHQASAYEGVKFSHQLHTTAGVKCLDCHPKDGESIQTPAMTDCVHCHEKSQATNRCDACHVSKASGVLITRLDRGRLMPSSRVLPHVEHGPGFARHHGAAAKMEPALCRSCHEENECQTCHLTRDRLTGIHPGDYVRMHAVEARHRSTDCQSCHNPTQFCAPCHTQAGITIRPGPRSFGLHSGVRRFHPPNFAGPIGSPNEHGRAARRNLQACVSCHAEDDCVRCHSAGAPSSLRATPHPPGFRCGRALDVSASGCLKCHQDLASLRRLCQGR